jgi:hypothetical protein
MKSIRLSAIAILVILTSTLSIAGPSDALLQAPAAQEGAVESTTATIAAPTMIQVSMSSEPPVLTAEQLAAQEEMQARGPLPRALPLPEGNTAVQRPDSMVDPNTATAAPDLLASEQPMAPSAPGTFTLFRDTDFGATIKANTSGSTGEPVAANTGGVVFATGNWWAAISADGGQSFQYINPYTMFPASYGGFCCDQMAVYDPSRDLFIWSLQYLPSGPAGSGQNLFRIAAARPADALRGVWWYWDFDSEVNTEWDFPSLCLSNDYVYYLTNRGPYNAGYVNDSWVFRFPLDPISTGAGFSYGYLDAGNAGLNNLSWNCANGARDVAYFASHNTTSQIRILRWAENTGTLYWDNVNLSEAWPNATRICPTPDGRDWCGFDDGRIKAGWIGRGMIGFMWNGSAGGSFAAPYVEAVRVRESDRAYVDRPYMWNSTVAFQYPAAAPNARGDVGIVAHYSSSSIYPSFGVGIDDDFSRDNGYGPPGWELKFVRQGTQGPNVNRWGDYFSVQPFAPNGLGWIATGHTMQGCGVAGCKETRFEIFGRERDLHSIERYYNGFLGAFLPIVTR